MTLFKADMCNDWWEAYGHWQEVVALQTRALHILMLPPYTLLEDKDRPPIESGTSMENNEGVIWIHILLSSIIIV